jgi:hypothetical protein
MFYGLDLDPDMLWIQNDWIRNPFQQMPGSGLRFSESRLKSLTMRNYRDETPTEFVPVLGKIFGKEIFS